ncbi:uncharacterized protein LOC116007371 [Ipomoea triloba]|uniref:uncharacterized protein LOC116007371 n=1 Tax=Ipomoea triloba TaxID=35885 RepID=UPI00125E8312|nr:uncharacterized protein LOC116007371 [Ipomoea triloba]
MELARVLKELKLSFVNADTSLALSCVSMLSQVASIVKFNGLNFAEWHEQIQFHLGVLDLDLALLTDKPAAIDDNSSADDVAFHQAWERSNRLSMMLMRMTLERNIKSTIPKFDSAKDLLKHVEKNSLSECADKALAGTLMGKLTTMKFDGSRSMHQHVTEMLTLAGKLRSMEMEVSDTFLVQFILNSLPHEYERFQVNYNSIKDKWNVLELHKMLNQEERRLKGQGIHSVNIMS